MSQQSKNNSLSLVLFWALILMTAGKALAQNAAIPPPQTTDNELPSNQGNPPPSTDQSTPAPGKKPSPRLVRWFDLQMATIFARYRYVDNSSGLITANQSQHKESFKARLKFDAEGKYSLNAGVFSGRVFIGTWNNTGWGTGTGQSNLALKQLYFSAAPVRGLEVQYGGLYLLRGESTEITSYDEDGYIIGERVSLKRPNNLFFDEISVTYAYLGDINTPNLNKRFHRLKQSNYHQFLIEKKIGRRVAVSADYTFEAGRDTLRQAVSVKLQETHLLDTARFENYFRLSGQSAYGFALQGEKALFGRLTVAAGYAQIDPQYGGLNADRFGSGKRLFLSTNLRLFSDISLLSYATRAIANDVPVAQRTRLDLIVSYNLLQSLKHAGLF